MLCTIYICAPVIYVTIEGRYTQCVVMRLRCKPARKKARLYYSLITCLVRLTLRYSRCLWINWSICMYEFTHN
jgi:hypothetical protein